MAIAVSNSVALPSVNSSNGVLTDEFVNGLVQGGSWQFSGGPRTLTYSFNINFDFDGAGNLIPGSGGAWLPPPSSFLMNSVNRALAEWSNVANINFQNITSGSYFFQSSADIAFTLTGNELQSDPEEPAVGLGVFPDPVLGGELRDLFASNGLTYNNPEGDVFFDNYFAGYQDVTLAIGAPASYGFEVMLHEIGHALGLKHPDDDGANSRPTFAQLGIADYDMPRWTVMSNNPTPGSTLQMGNATTPMPLDILAIQQIYGANMAYHAGNDDYQLGPYTTGLYKGEIYRTLWDAGGIDTIRVSGLTGGGVFGPGSPGGNGSGIGVTIDLRPGIGFVRGENAFPGQPSFSAPAPSFSSFSTTYTAIAFNVIIENVVGSQFDDSITGNDVGNLIGGGGGNDVLDGGAGNDTATFAGRLDQYAFVSYQNVLSVVDKINSRDGVDRLINMEQAQFSGGGGTVVLKDVNSFTPLEYIASYGDLMNAFGANAQSGYIHFVSTGRLEGRQADFNASEYIASYVDLMNAFSANEEAGAIHYVQTGRFEGRGVSFNALEYVASYGDLMNAFGTREDSGATHFIQTGRFEGRRTSFDGLEYIASYGDLINAFGANSDAGATHYINAGRFEGRTEHFDPARYLANYADLRAAFGADLEAATQHFIQHGYFEGRTDHM